MAPSWRARTWVTTPAMVTGARGPSVAGSSRVVTTTSSSCRYAPGATATQNCSGVASSLPSTRPTGSPWSAALETTRSPIPAPLASASTAALVNQIVPHEYDGWSDPGTYPRVAHMP